MESPDCPAGASATLTVVIPIYNEEGLLQELAQRLTRALDALENIRWEVLFVNDGSADRTGEMLGALHARDPRFGYLNLSRNFGHQAAITAGLAEAKGDAVVVMDGDLEDPPEAIPDMVAAWRSGASIVRSEHRSRHDTGLRNLGFTVFHKFFGLFSDIPIPANAGVFGLMDRQAVVHFNQFTERHRFLPGLRAWLGFEQRVVQYDRGKRAAGQPKQTLRRLIRYALDAVFSFSYLPLRLLTYCGLTISLFGFLLGAFFALKRVLGMESASTGFTTLVTLILFLGGIQLIGIGIIGEYLGRIYDEVKQRPLFIVKKKVPGQAHAGSRN